MSLSLPSSAFLLLFKWSVSRHGLITSLIVGLYSAFSLLCSDKKVISWWHPASATIVSGLLILFLRKKNWVLPALAGWFLTEAVLRGVQGLIAAESTFYGIGLLLLFTDWFVCCSGNVKRFFGTFQDYALTRKTHGGPAIAFLPPPAGNGRKERPERERRENSSLFLISDKEIARQAK